MKRRTVLCAILLGLATVACTQPSTVQEDTATIKRIGYYEDFQNSRVVAFTVAEGATPEEIRAHAESLTFTPDRLLAAYYFAQGSRKVDPNALRWSRTIMQAVDLLHDDPEIDPWHYAYMRTFLGEIRFADCTQSPDDALCRKVDSEE